MATKRNKLISPEEGSESSSIKDLVDQYEGKYWVSSVFITGYGQVNGGKATREQLEAFISKMNPETDLDNWLSDKDVFTEYVKKNTIKKNPAA